MRIAHLSDLHFGTESPEGVAALRNALTDCKPDLVAVSGDLTQIGSRKEFAAAQDFLESLKIPALVVPGNHDQPRYKLWKRFSGPFNRFRRYIEPERIPTHKSDTILVAGINSARPAVPHWNWANGAISRTQLERLHMHYSSARAETRICVMHHPIHKAAFAPIKTRVFGAHRARRAMEEMKVDVVLTGHVHTSSLDILGDSHRTIYLSASTALSSRQRGEANGFNLIDINEDAISVGFYARSAGEFVLGDKKTVVGQEKVLEEAR